jgi:nicotinic acid phosphoribosyltransferase
MLNKILEDLKKHLAEHGIDNARVAISCRCNDEKTGKIWATNILSHGFGEKLTESKGTQFYSEDQSGCGFRWVLVEDHHDEVCIFYDVNA